MRCSVIFYSFWALVSPTHPCNAQFILYLFNKSLLLSYFIKDLFQISNLSSVLFSQFDNNFYFSAQYFAAEQLFLFYVMVIYLF